jgi:hypothetical protein
MAKYAARVQETTTTTGTGALSLDGAVAGYQGFLDPSNIGDGDYVPYMLLDGDGSSWERGMGLLASGSPNTLTRSFVFESSNAGAAIDLTSGTHTVMLTPHPEIRSFRGCRLQPAAQDVTSQAWLTIGTELEDTDDCWTSGDDEWITPPAWADRWRVHALICATNSSDPGGERTVEIWHQKAIDEMVGIGSSHTLDGICAQSRPFVRYNEYDLITVRYKNSTGVADTINSSDSVIVLEVLE